MLVWQLFAFWWSSCRRLLRLAKEFQEKGDREREGHVFGSGGFVVAATGRRRALIYLASTCFPQCSVRPPLVTRLSGLRSVHACNPSALLLITIFDIVARIIEHAQGTLSTRSDGTIYQMF